ncbi:MAG: chorismate mutase [Chloroflexi bacterium]|nr:chorismate mutase [Chloroflexota bacterium]
MSMKVRGVRGATTANDLSRGAVLDATTELLKRMVDANAIQADDVAAALFSTSPDLTSEFPALAAREGLGWNHVPLMCTHEMSVPHGQQRCIRILLFWNTDRPQSEIKHIYLREAANLRQRSNSPPAPSA